VPKFKEIFTGMNAQLPAVTQTLLGISTWVQSGGWLAIIGFPFFFWLTVRLLKISPGGRYFVDNTKAHLPVFGQIVSKTAVARFSRTLGTLLSAGVPILEAINITSDNTAVSAFEAIVKVCNEKKIPLFAGDVGSVPRGAIAAYGLDYFLIGYSGGKKAAQILKGKKAGEIPWGPAEKFSLVVSEKAAKAQGIVIPPDLLKKADNVIKE